jgi:hypothetical protein
MSRKLVLMGVFLTVLPALLVSVKVRGNDPPKRQVVNAVDPFGDASAAKPAINAGKPKAGLAAQKPAKAGGLKTAAPNVVDDEAAEHRIREALASPTQIDFENTRFTDLITYLKDLHHIEIQLDSAALKDASFDADPTVTKKLKGISLRQALKSILDDLRLKYVVHNGVLLITTPEKAESDDYMETRFLPVEDLVLVDGHGPLSVAHLLDLLTNTVATKSWVDNGGCGTVSPFIVGNRVLLVVSQTEEANEQIESTLEKLRTVAGLKTAAQRVAAEALDGSPGSSVANPKAEVLHLKTRDVRPVVPAVGAGTGATAEELKADARQKENIEKRIDFLNARIAAQENLLTQTSDAGKRQALLQEYSAEVKALKDLFDARATLRNATPRARHEDEED